MFFDGFSIGHVPVPGGMSARTIRLRHGEPVESGHYLAEEARYSVLTEFGEFFQ